MAARRAKIEAWKQKQAAEYAKKQKELEAIEKKRVFLLLKVAYQVKRDGLLRFLVLGDNVANFAARMS